MPENRVASGNKKTVGEARTRTPPRNNEDTKKYRESPESDQARVVSGTSPS